MPGLDAFDLAIALLPPALASALLLTGGLLGFRRAGAAGEHRRLAPALFALAVLGGYAGAVFTYRWIRAFMLYL